jgi:hypothetical protein
MTPFRDAGARAPVVLIAAALLGACSGDAFSADPGGSDAAAGAGGASGTGGAGGGAGDAGRGGASATAGVAGGTTTDAGGGAGGGGCACSPGEYCAEGDCLPCNGIGRFEFGVPELLGAFTMDASLRFPRAYGAAGLTFTAAATLAQPVVWMTQDLAASAGSPLAEADGPGAESAPVWFAALPDSPLGKGPTLLFDREALVGDADRDLYALEASGATYGSADLLPPPLNLPGASDFQIAIAPDKGRAWWHSTRSGTVELLTASTGALTAEVVAPAAATPSGTVCAILDVDVTPWAMPDGRLLLLSAAPVDDDCNPLGGGAARDLYAVHVSSASGQPVVPAAPLGAVNEPGADDTDPSLSADLCWLYFASDRANPGARRHRLYRAPRQ